MQIEINKPSSIDLRTVKRRKVMASTHRAGGKSSSVHPVETPAVDMPHGDAVRLQGYVGPIKDGRTLRLYADFEDLSEYIDVPRAEVLRQAAAPEAAAPNGGVYAWVKPAAELVYTRTHSVTALARDIGGASARDAQLANEFRRRNPRATVLASLTAGTNAVLFVEFRPGLTGIVESAPVGQSHKTDALRGRTLGSIYSELLHLPAPPALVDAAGRTMEAPPAKAPKPPHLLKARGASAAAVSRSAKSEASPVDAGHITPFTSSEQAWFNSTFCNGAHICVQGWDWATSGNIWYGSYEVVTMVGSEGTVNASLVLYNWDSGWSLFTGSWGYWVEFYNAVNVPGHWISVSVSGATAGNTYASLSGAGGGTQVSMAVR
jgi:hypothetical protein